LKAILVDPIIAAPSWRKKWCWHRSQAPVKRVARSKQKPAKCLN